MSTVVSRARSISTMPIAVRKGSVLVVLSWGSVAWYLCVGPTMTVGELRRQVAKQVGRLFDGVIVGLELLITGTDIAPDLFTQVSAVTHPPYRNVCLDVVGAPRSAATGSINSVGERLLRRHLSQARFQAGVGQRAWRLIELKWPHAVFGIRTSGRECREMALRLNFEKYPVAPPLVELWNAETRSVIESPDWTEPFIRFASATYPQVATFPTSPFCENLLRISMAVASRMKSAESDTWDVTGDLTQVLARASGCFRAFAGNSIPSLHQNETIPDDVLAPSNAQIQLT